MDKDISRDTLVCHGIYFEPNVYQPNGTNTQPTAHTLPDHVDAVRDGLLCMKKILPEDCDATLREELVKHGSANIGPHWCLHPQGPALARGKHHERMLQQSPCHDNLKFCEDVAEAAQEIQDDSEAEWTFFWRRKVFTLFSDEVHAHSGFDPTLDAWSLYEDVQWNEFDNFVRPCPPGAPHRTQSKPDLTYAFPFQTSTPDRLEGFARDELTQALSLQSLGKLVERGVACAPTTALRKGVNLPDATTWSSSDRSCFPWAVVEMKKNVSAPHDVAVERCYCQAANAAAAALDLQAQLFDKLNDSTSLRLPPVVAFTCIGPVVKVWLAYQDKSRIFGPTIQRMVCIWSTSVRLTWGVASLRAIIKNMHTWSSRLLKPRLQIAVSQASRKIPASNPFDFHRPLSRCLPVLTVDYPEAVPINHSSTPPSTSARVTPIIAQTFGKPVTPEKHDSPAPHIRIDTPTPSRSSEGTSLRSNSQVREASNSQNGSLFGASSNVIGDRSTTRTPGLFGRATGSGAGVFNRPCFGSGASTAIGVGLRSQGAIKSGGLFGGGVIPERRQDKSGSNASSSCNRGRLFETSNPVTTPSDNHEDSDKSSTSGSPSKLARNSSGSNDSINSRLACGSIPKPKFGPTKKPVSGISDTVDICPAGSSSSKQALGPSWRPIFGNNDNISKLPIPGSLPESASVSSPNSANGSSCKSTSSSIGASSDSGGGGLLGSSNLSNNVTPRDMAENTSSPSAEETGVWDITTAFGSTSLEDVFRYHTNLGTVKPLFSAHRELSGYETEEFQTITFQSPYQDYSLEELRMADYDRGRRYRLSSSQLGQSTDSPTTQGDDSDDKSDHNSDAASNDDSDTNNDFDHDTNYDSDYETDDYSDDDTSDNSSDDFSADSSVNSSVESSTESSDDTIEDSNDEFYPHYSSDSSSG